MSTAEPLDSIITQVQPETSTQKKATINKLKLKLSLATSGTLPAPQQASNRDERQSTSQNPTPTRNSKESVLVSAGILQAVMSFFNRTLFGKKKSSEGSLAKIDKGADTERGTKEPEIMKTGILDATPTNTEQAASSSGSLSPQSPTSTTPSKTAFSDSEAQKRPAPPPADQDALSIIALPPRKVLLPEISHEDTGKKCLVLDLDETLVHSSFKAVPGADFIIPVEIDAIVHSVYVLKRPGVDHFLERLGSQFELVVFTASLSKYADPVLDSLDKTKRIKHRLFRESCINHNGNYVKDLSILGRDLKGVVIIDNSPASYIFHPSNAIPITSWFNDPNDTELYDLVPFLEDLRHVDNVTHVLDQTML